MNESNNINENELLNNERKLRTMNSLLIKNKFSEDFLIKTREYYDSWKCLRTQNNLSPYFCFRYLYDTQEYDSADNWTDYNDVIRYLGNKYDKEYIYNEFIRAMNDRKS